MTEPLPAVAWQERPRVLSSSAGAPRQVAGAAREQQPDRPRVSVVPSVVFEGVRVLSARDSLLNLFFFLFAGALYICSSSSGALIDSCWQNNCLRRQTLGPFFAYTAAVCGFLPYPAHVSLELMLTTLNYPRR